MSHDEVILSWSGKDCVLAGGRTEVLLHKDRDAGEIARLLAPKVLTGFVRHAADGRQEVRGFRRDAQGVLRENLVIRGDALAAAHCLLPLFRGRVKLAYLDPPFNTGADGFGYPDDFRHSTWLTFMRDRLEAVRDLLAPDGSLYVHLDSNEVHYCKALLDGIFGRRAFQREIVWRIGWVSGYKTRARNWIRNHDTILFYAKGDLTFHKEYIPYAPGYVRRDGKPPKGQGYALEDTWNCSDLDRLDSIQIKSFDREKTGFATQKPEALLRRILHAATREGDLVLDLCAGSGTTGAAAHKMNRQYVLVERMDRQAGIAVARLEHVLRGDPKGISRQVGWRGGGEFLSCALLGYDGAFGGRIAAARSSREMAAVRREMAEGSLLDRFANPAAPQRARSDFLALGRGPGGLERQKRHLLGLLEADPLYVGYGEMGDPRFGVAGGDMALNRAFYGDAASGA